MLRVILVGRADLLYWMVGDRVEWRPRGRWYVRAWRWITKQNYRVHALDFEGETLIIERCR